MAELYGLIVRLGSVSEPSLATPSRLDISRTHSGVGRQLRNAAWDGMPRSQPVSAAASMAVKPAVSVLHDTIRSSNMSWLVRRLLAWTNISKGPCGSFGGSRAFRQGHQG